MVVVVSAAKQVRPRLPKRHEARNRGKTLIFMFNKKEYSNQEAGAPKQNSYRKSIRDPRKTTKIYFFRVVRSVIHLIS